MLKRIGIDDAEGLQELVSNPAVYRYLPTFLFEKKYPDVRKVIALLYTECFKESIITGIYTDEGLRNCTDTAIRYTRSASVTVLSSDTGARG